MAIQDQPRVKLLLLALLLSCFIGTTSCGSREAEQDKTITIHAGSAGGAYSRLVERFNQRLPNNCDASHSLHADSIACLQGYTIKVACSDGGSVTNLRRLGMKLRDGELDQLKPCKQRQNGEWIEISRDQLEKQNSFALVQNFFVYGAAAESCQNRDASECTSKAAKENLKEFQYFEELRIVLPMYYGRIQLITSNGRTKVNSLTDLADRKVYLGNEVNMVHGTEVLHSHPELVNQLEKKTISQDQAIKLLDELFEGALIEKPKGQKNIGNVLLACGKVDAYLISGELISEKPINLSKKVPENCQKTITPKQIPIPEVIIDGMAEEHPYYQKVDAPPSLIKTGFRDKMPAVTTYLVTTEDAAESTVGLLTKALLADWRNLMLLNDDLVRLEENIYKQPAPLHPGAREALQDANMLGKDIVPWYIALIGVATLFALFWKTEVSYDRLGEQGSGSSGRTLSRLILILFGTVMFFVLVVKFIRLLEGDQATEFGTDNPIANRGFPAVLLWMFTFVSSGYDMDLFPSSPVSIFVVGLFAIVGIAFPIWAIVKVIDHMREGRLAKARGGETRSWLKRKTDKVVESLGIGYRSKGILLLCGWNNKAPGLVYSLTCPDSPYPGMINIIADMDVEYPIQHWRFNKQRVRFYRGDASHRATLERADGLQANNALILADYNAGSSSNTAGVLTALAMKKLQEKRKNRPLFVAAEMTLKEDDLRFSKAHVNDIVDPRLITRRMLSIACFNKHVLSFVLDALSPDDQCEWYSIEAKVLKNHFIGKKDDLTIGDYRRALQQHEINVVGVCSKEPLEAGGNFSPDFKKDKYLNPLVSHKDLALPLPPESYIVCAAMSPESFTKSRIRKTFANVQPQIETSVRSTSILSPTPARSRVVIIGHSEQAESLNAHIRNAFPGIKTGIIATDKSDGVTLDKDISASINKKDWTHVILLSSMPESHGSKEYARYSRQADSETILRANLIKTALDEKKSPATIVAEVNNTHSRRLAEDAGVTTVVPSSLLVERILARLVSGRGHVSEMLLAMLSVSDGIYLRSVELQPDDHLVGRSFSYALNTWFADGRVLGFLPYALRKQYRNESEDFGTHFAMGPTKEVKDLELQVNDVVIVLSYPQNHNAVSEYDIADELYVTGP